MIRCFLLAIFGVGAMLVLVADTSPQSNPEPRSGHFLHMDKALIPLNSPEGRKLLRESKYQEAFWNLSQFYSPQPDLGSCSVASCTMVLNAMPIDRPVSKRHAPYRLFTAENFFNPEVEKILKIDKQTARERVSSSGMSLGELSQVLTAFPVKVKCMYGSRSDIDTLRKVVRKSLADAKTHVVVNYLRKALHQESGEHISPLAAYNEETDRILIMDTSNYKYPWTWVKTEALWQAMAETVDDETKLSRGYVVVSEKGRDSR